MSTAPSIEQAAYEGIISSARDYPALKEKSKTSLERSVRSSDSNERRVFHELLLEPKDHTHQIISQCTIDFMITRAKYRKDLILTDFNLAVGWPIRYTAKFSGYTVYGMTDVGRGITKDRRAI
jgi:hypothetical protein